MEAFFTRSNTAHRKTANGPDSAVAEKDNQPLLLPVEDEDVEPVCYWFCREDSKPSAAKRRDVAVPAFAVSTAHRLGTPQNAKTGRNIR